LDKYILEDTKKPGIYIFINEDVKEETLKDMILGIEEEGIPYELKKIVGKNINSLASMASESSLLGVGIGVDKNKIILHQEKLTSKSYVFCINLSSTPNELREIGENAARIVKKVPFKNKYL